MIKDDSVDVQSQIINYQSLSDSHLNNNVENLVLPLSGKMKFEKKTYELNLEQFEATCVQLNAALQNKTYLVGNELSIADSTVAVCLKPAFENILGEAEREKYPNLVAWYGTVSSDGKLKKHLKTQMTKDRRAHVWTPVTQWSRMPSSAWKKKIKRRTGRIHNQLQWT